MRPEDPELARLLGQAFVPVRLTSLKGVDLDTFDFDYDQTLMALGMSPDGRILFRWTARDDDARALPDLKTLLRGPWAIGAGKGTARPRRTLADNPRFAATRRAGEACYHCHYAHDAWVADLRAAGKFDKALLYRYPPPETVGLHLAGNASAVVRAVDPGSAAQAAGLRAGDRLTTVNGRLVRTDADVRVALDRIPRGKSERLEAAWLRDGASRRGSASLKGGWREYDISDRPSQGSVPPILGIWEEKLPADRRAALGLKPDRLALRVSFLFPGAKWAPMQGDLKLNDVIVAVDGKELEDLSARQFHTWFRMHKEVGQSVVLTVLRGTRRVEVRVSCVDPGMGEE